MRRHILIIGAGFSGISGALSAALFLKKNNCTDVSVTVLSPLPTEHGALVFDECGSRKMESLLTQLFENGRIKFVAGIANGIDAVRHRVEYTASQGIYSWITYDRLILAAGSRVVRPHLDGVEHAFDVNPLDTTACLEKHITALAHYPDSTARNTVVICGGGFSGLESATRIPARLHSRLGPDVKIKVIVIDGSAEMGSGPAGRLNPQLAQSVARHDIEWHLNARVASLDTNGITLIDGRRIESKTVVWTVGHRASHLTEHISTRCDRLGRLHVDQSLQVLGHQDIYAAGDVAALGSVDEGCYPTRSYQLAVSMGDTAGHNAAADILGAPRKTCLQREAIDINA